MPPRIVTARSIGLQFRMNQLERMGPERGTVGHYSGVPGRARNLAEGIAKAKSFHQGHLNNGWAGIGYHYLIADDGSIICCRSTFHKGAHVEGMNDGRIGVNMPGTLQGPPNPVIRDRPTRRQARAFNWLLHNAHTTAMPRVHRTDRDLSRLPILGHKDLSSTSCPGLFHGMYLRGGEPWVEPTRGTDEEIPEGFVDLTPREEVVLADLEAGNAPDHDADAKLVGPDEEELASASDADERLELPEGDEEFDEDLSELLAEIETKPEQPA
jgi:hypothetical protein